ncbi:MAG: translation initiation factor IF-3 [Caldiserica bacterium]|nr:translation initiation factor IF-3 [Caldisericota bacterium]
MSRNPRFHTQQYRVNERIRVREVRVVDPQGRQIGIMGRDQALRLASDLGLDLVEVASQTYPPVCRIMDYGKFKYEQKKREKDAKKKQKSQEVKEVKFRPSIDEHDLDRKVQYIKDFLQEGHKVRVILFFRGREMVHLDRGRKLLEKIRLEVEKEAETTKTPTLMGRILMMVLSPKGRS